MNDDGGWAVEEPSGTVRSSKWQGDCLGKKSKQKQHQIWRKTTHVVPPMAIITFLINKCRLFFEKNFVFLFRMKWKKMKLIKLRAIFCYSDFNMYRCAVESLNRSREWANGWVQCVVRVTDATVRSIGKNNKNNKKNRKKNSKMFSFPSFFSFIYFFPTKNNYHKIACNLNMICNWNVINAVGWAVLAQTLTAQ